MDDKTLTIVCDDAVAPENRVGKYIYLDQLGQDELYPDDYVLYKTGFNLAKKCRELHFKGLIAAKAYACH